MDGEQLSFPSLESSTTETNDTSPRIESLQQEQSNQETWAEGGPPLGDSRHLSTEEHVTLNNESFTITSTDQEKLLLLNKNTELRRVNKELMKLNQDWDQVYHSATTSLHHRLKALELENNAIKQLNCRLLRRDHQQAAQQYYEQALIQEIKKNEELQNYIQLLERRTQKPETDCKQTSFIPAIHTPCPKSAAAGHPNLPHSKESTYKTSPSLSPAGRSPGACSQGKGQRISFPPGVLGESEQEVQDLKEQVAALRCQTEIYEAEYQTEHTELKHTQQDNIRLRKKREEMRQQVALLTEQLKVYEDDFWKERSDKQMLQRLLLQKRPQSKQPVLVPRC
ncbi:uncharacterized protein LOC114471634 isoform X2 [Gouania willdenowi]|uniref:uncharacterized protein LOC114471634 isoform X2 n=1 Tax=Gouania willdenowi TaxID=441366 RepID=UPI0010547092|nr:uncharacterized protein LOC114471634 isoform X2 [Gouania willdenowi]